MLDGDRPALGLFIAVAVTSVRLARKRISYESWYGIHLYAYLAVALGFAHQLVVGTDFIDDALARAYWIGLYVVVIGCLFLAFRVLGAPDRASTGAIGFEVGNVIAEGPGVWSRLSHGARPRCHRHPPAGQYLCGSVPGARLWWRAPSVFDLGRAQWSLAPVHGQGTRRRFAAARPAGGSEPGSSSKVRTAT